MPTRPPPPAPGPTDTVPAMLTPGEYVLTRDAVRRIGVGKLNQLNQGYQEGGPVDDPAPRATWVGGVAPRATLVSPPAVTTGPVTLGFKQGYATNFASPDDLRRYQEAKSAGKSETEALLAGDNGVGNPDLGTVSTPNAFGVAFPQSYLQQNLGDDPNAYRTARAQLTVNGRTVMVPIVDYGPGKDQQKKGVVTDATYPLSEALGGFDMARANVHLVPNAGPDYTKDQNAWYAEQGTIAQRLGVPGIGATPAPTQGYQGGGRVIPPAEAQALQTAGQYAGTSQVLTPENAPSYGLDPSKGFINPNVGVSPPAPQAPAASPAPVLTGVAPTQGGAARADPNPLFQSSQQVAQGQRNEDPRVEAVPEKPSPTKPAEDPRVEAVPEKPQANQQPLPAEDPRVEAVPRPVQTQPPLFVPPDISPQAPQTAQQLDQDAQIQALIAQGKKPGEAQAIVAGQQPKTLNGQTPPPAEKPAAPPQDPNARLPTSNDNYVAPQGAHDVMGINRNVWQNVMSEEGKEFGLDPGTNHMSVFGLWEGTPGPEGDAYNAVKKYGNTSTEAYNAVTTAWSQKFLGQSQPWKLTSPGLQELVIADSQHKGGAAALAILKKMGGSDNPWDDINKMDPKQAIAAYSKLRYPLWEGNANRVVREGQWALKYDRTIADGAPPDMTADTSKLIMPPADKSGTAASGGKGKAGQDTLERMPDSETTASTPTQAQTPLGTRGGGGGGIAQIGDGPASPGGALSWSPFLMFGGRGGGGGGGGGGEEEPSPSPAWRGAGGTMPPEAEPSQLALTQNEKLANVLGVRTVGAPALPPVPESKVGILPLPAPPAAPSGVVPQQGARLALPAPAAPAGPRVDPSVVQGLMKRGFTRAQAEAFAAKAAVSAPGKAAVTGSASFRPPAPAAPGQAAPAQKVTAQAPAPAKAPPPPGRGETPPPPPPREPSRRPAIEIPYGEGRRSTIGVPNPEGGPSPDDPRVKKQADGKIKGEYFVPGDDYHDQLLSGLPGGHQGRQRQIVGQAEQAIADKTPMHISYISAPKEAAKFPTRESREIQYEEHSPEARLMGTTTGQLVGHSMIPVSVGITPARKAGEPHQSVIHGISTNILANNFQHVNDKLAGMDRKTPYAQLGPKFFNDVQGYYANLNAGHTGTGRGYAVGTEDLPNDPDTSHVPYKLTRREADFINLVINNTAAFAKHADAGKLRDLARANGTLITEKGETNRLRHDIEQHEPGWRERVLEPSIRTFKTGLIHDVHPTEEHMPATIRPGKEFQDLTRAIAATAEQGRPDVPIAVSLHHTLDLNKAINRIERDFSDEKITEEEARHRLHEMGEDPSEYRFVGGSGGLITPYEDDPESITPQEHTQLKTNLRKQWIGGKMPIEDYRRKTAEVPLPEIPSRPPEPASDLEESATPAPSKPEDEPSKAPPAAPKPAPKAPPKAPEAQEAPGAPPAAPATETPPKYSNASPEDFIAAKNKTTRGGFLSALKPEEVAKHKLYLSHDKTSGAAVSPEGDIQNVFNNGGPKGAGGHALVHAIKNGGHTLDAFDPYLPHFYRQFGFKETGRMKFNRDYAPEGWDYAKDGEPDVVFMGHGGYPEGDAESALARAKGDRNQWLENEKSRNYSDDFDSQKQASRTFAKGAGVHPVAGEEGEKGALASGDQPRTKTGQGDGRPLAPEAPSGAVEEGPPAAPSGKVKKTKKSPEQIAAEKEDLRQADIHRKNVTPEQQAARDEIQRKAQQALAENPESDPLSAHHYINGHADLPDWIKTKEGIGKHFDEVNPKLDYAKDEHRQRAADALTHDVLHGLSKNSSAYDWYDDTVDKSLNHIGQVAPKILTHKDHEMAFKLATAITSQGQDVFPNFESGYLGYRHWHKTGQLPEDPAIFGGGTKAQAMVANFKKINRLWKELGPDGLREVLEKQMTMRELRDKYGIKLAGESPDHVMEGAAMLGPKIGSFYNNLNKRFHSTTFDLWATRNLNRIAGRMLKFSPNSLLKDSVGKKGPKPGQLSRLDALLANGKIEGADVKQQKTMRAEAAALRKLKNPTRERVLGAAPTIAEWAGREHGRYAKGTGGRSYPKELKSDSTSLAKNMDLNLTDLADAPRGPKQRQQFRDIYQRTQDNLAKHGIDMAHASNQAVLWFIEQKLFQMGGSRNRASFDYLDASHRLVRKIRSGELPALHGQEPMQQAA